MRILFFSLLLVSGVTHAFSVSSDKWQSVNMQIGVVSSQDGQVALYTKGGGVIFMITPGGCDPSKPFHSEVSPISVNDTLVNMKSRCDEMTKSVVHQPSTEKGAVYVIEQFLVEKEVKVFNSTFTSSGFIEMAGKLEAASEAL